ncbi:hypothetical protein ACQUSR_28245 [Streptomyces sp. P1-3]|uniref:hypothetical protein n=1 Tax=Streptomyces sp. P1-3 TaxID=3421658 RepID=UPI003D36E5AB
METRLGLWCHAHPPLRPRRRPPSLSRYHRGCTTVSHAQATYQQLAAEPGDQVDLHLLHARLPAHQRATYTQRAETAFGRVIKPTTQRPQRGVIVATQVFRWTRRLWTRTGWQRRVRRGRRVTRRC